MDLRLKQQIEQILIQSDFNVADAQWDRVGGGSINMAYKFSANNKQYFIKTNTTTIFSNGFKEEVLGLEFLQKNNARTPNILAEGNYKGQTYLVLEWINTGDETKEFWSCFAQQLAALHKNTSDSFGLNHNNFMGQLEQINNPKKTFYEFFIENRLKPQLILSINNGLLDRTHVGQFEQLFNRLEQLIPVEPPAAVHGDLWSGNYICGVNGQAFLIDPAVYYGHREIDIAMTRLFGGFHSQFYEAYQEIFPMEKNFLERADIYNLYPLLIHLNLFGSSYRNSILRIINRF